MDADTDEYPDETSHPFEICRRNEDNSVLNGTHGYPGDNVYVTKTLFKTIAFSKNLQHSFWYGQQWTFMYVIKVVLRTRGRNHHGFFHSLVFIGSFRRVVCQGGRNADQCE